ncbi:MAG: hypothetical protein ACYTEU_14045, partial [Planctomycetota bacterium]
HQHFFVASVGGYCNTPQTTRFKRHRLQDSKSRLCGVEYMGLFYRAHLWNPEMAWLHSPYKDP